MADLESVCCYVNRIDRTNNEFNYPNKGCKATFNYGIGYSTF